jgi:HAD superfamily hydrolase (TIGR01549 family)
VFDLDGTLTKPGAIDFARLRARLAMPSSHPDILGWTAEQPPHEREKLARIIEEEEQAGLDNLHLNTGAEALFAFLAARTPRLYSGVLTRNNEGVMRQSLARLDLLGGRHAFDTLVSRDFAGAPKPSPDGLLHMASAWRIHASEIFMVGDAPDDMQAARAAGALAVAIGDDAEAAQLAHRRVRTLCELVPLLEELGA